jgi:hypothetical protein
LANPIGSSKMPRVLGLRLSKGLGRSPRKEVFGMAKTEKGKKIVPVKPHYRKVDGKVKVRRHRRSTPN